MARPQLRLTWTRDSELQGVEQALDLGFSSRAKTSSDMIGFPPVVTESDQGRVASLCATEAEHSMFILAPVLPHQEDLIMVRCLA